MGNSPAKSAMEHFSNASRAISDGNGLHAGIHGFF
jgi:hypothetical protein